MTSTERGATQGRNATPGVELRPYPFPYRAAMTICSDIDGTTTLERFLSIQQFLNTEAETGMGQGVGLEIGNSFFPLTPDGSFSYLSSGREDRETLDTLIQAGYVDALHSYGDGAATREDALRSLEELGRAGSRLDVWIDHARAPSNLGKDTSPGVGDVPGSPIYHADATLAAGIRFVWKGRGTSIVGQDVPYSPAGFLRLIDGRHPRHSAANLAKELVKIALAQLGSPRFAIHSGNRLLRVSPLADGQRVYEFNRCNSYWQGLSYGHDAWGLAYVLRSSALEALVASRGVMVVYTHIGTGPETPPYLPPETQSALRGLAALYRSGTLYVTTTSRLLNYWVNRSYLMWDWHPQGDRTVRIDIAGAADRVQGVRKPNAAALQGITFYVPDRSRADVYLYGRPLPVLQRNPSDSTGRESVSIPRIPLVYPLPSPHPATLGQSLWREAKP
ncbi:MAG TPA: hypothetical protein VFD42_07665 [Chloroflexota bacterium]|nr:hypothetical protein [Chloroflexota bacterium]